MALKLVTTGFFLAALAWPSLAAGASEPASKEKPGEARAERQAPRAGREAPVELICRSVEIAAAGPDAAPILCMSAAEWRRADQ